MQSILIIIFILIHLTWNTVCWDMCWIGNILFNTNKHNYPNSSRTLFGLLLDKNLTTFIIPTIFRMNHKSQPISDWCYGLTSAGLSAIRITVRSQHSIPQLSGEIQVVNILIVNDKPNGKYAEMSNVVCKTIHWMHSTLCSPIITY